MSELDEAIFGPSEGDLDADSLLLSGLSIVTSASTIWDSTLSRGRAITRRESSDPPPHGKHPHPTAALPLQGACKAPVRVSRPLCAAERDDYAQARQLIGIWTIAQGGSNPPDRPLTYASRDSFVAVAAVAA
jgi:hypothetical protein